MPIPPAGPLNGITVVDLTRILAGPYCTMVLSDLGARIIKVERPGSGDDARAIGPFVSGRSAYFMSLNRGKESIALDLSEVADRAIFDRLLDRADVLVENFRPGAMERLGYGWEAVHERWPRIVYASTSGFGQTGPLAARPAYDMVAQGLGGIMSLTGHPGAEPTRVGTSIGDLSAGMFTAIAVNAALFDRTRSGEGQRIDVAMLDSQVAILENAIARYQATGEIPGPLGARHPSITPFGAFRTADGFIIIAAGNDTLFQRLCGAIGAPELAARPEYTSNLLRTDNEPQLKRDLERALAARPTAEWLECLETAELPCAPIQDVAQVLDDPQVRSRNMVVEVEDAVAGTLRMAGNPMKLSGYPDPPTRGPVPPLDCDREKIIDEFCGD